MFSSYAGVTEQQKNRPGIKRLKNMETKPCSLKKPRTKNPAAAMKSLLSGLYIKEKRKKTCHRKSVALAPENSISSDICQMSPPQLETDSCHLDYTEFKENLSRTWPDFVNSQYTISKYGTAKNQARDSLKACEANVEDCFQNYLDKHNCNLAHRPSAGSIKLGISVLQRTNTTKCYTQDVPLELKQDKPESSWKFTSSAITTCPSDDLVALNCGHDEAVSRDHGNRKVACNMADGSGLSKISLSHRELGICDELYDQTNILFLPVKGSHISRITECELQSVNECCNTKNLSIIPNETVLQGTESTRFEDTNSKAKSEGQQFSTVQGSLISLTSTENSKFIESDFQFVNESSNSINFMKHQTKEVVLQNFTIARPESDSSCEDKTAPCTPASQQHPVCHQSGYTDELLAGSLVHNCVDQASPKLKDRQPRPAATINDRSSIAEENTFDLPSHQATAIARKYSQQRRCLRLDYKLCQFPVVTGVPSQLHVQKPGAHTETASTSACPTAIDTTGQVLAAAGTVSQPEHHEKFGVSLPKSARRCLHDDLNEQSSGVSLEIDSMPKPAATLRYDQAATLPCDIHKSPLISAASSRNSKTVAEAECTESPVLAHRVSRVTNAAGESCSQKQVNYPTFNSESDYMLERCSDLRPSDVSLGATGQCSNIQTKPSVVDVNGNYATFDDKPPLSPWAKLCLPSGNIQSSLSTSSPVHAKRNSRGNHDALQSLPCFVSPIRHKCKPGTNRNIADFKQRRKRQRHYHSNNKNNSLIPSTDDESDNVGPCSIHYIQLKKAADFIVNRIPFKKDIRLFINMKKLLEYLQSFFLNEMSKLSKTNVQNISEYKTLMTGLCQTISHEKLTLENCVYKLLVSIIINEPVLITTCSEFVFENLRCLSDNLDIYRIPPELLLMLLSNDKSIVLGYNGFPLSYEDSVGELKRVAARYIKGHKTGNSETDSKLEQMFSFVINQSVEISKCAYKNSEINLKYSHHEIKFKLSEEFITKKNLQEYSVTPDLSLTVTSPFQRKIEHSDPVESHEKYCNSTYTLRKIYFSYVVQDQIPYICQIRQQYAGKGKKVTYSIGNSFCSPASGAFRQPSHAGKYLTDSTTEDSSKTEKVTLVLKSNPLLGATSGVKSQAADFGDSSKPEPARYFKMSLIQLTRGENITGIMIQGEHALHNMMVITNQGRHIRAHGIVDFPNNSDWTLVPPPEESKYCLQAIVADIAATPAENHLQSVRVVWSYLVP